MNNLPSVAALYKSMREFEADAEKKAGFELKKAAEKRAALEQALVEAHALCKAAGENFKAFQEKHAPEYKRTRLYQVLAIADGRKTAEDVREGDRERKRRQRARESVRDVTDDSAPEGAKAPTDAHKDRHSEAPGAAKQTTLVFPDQPAQPVLMASAKKPLEEVQAEFAALADETPAEIDRKNKPASAATTNGKPDDDRPLAEKLHYHLNDIWSLCQDANNWSHLDADQKVEMRGAMTKLGYLRELLPRLATPAKSTMH